MHSSTRKNPGQPDAAGAGLPPVLLDARVVQPGDVLLTYSNSVTSKGIVIATRGPFSHAAVWMPAIGPDDVMLAEADGLGVGFTPMMPIRLEHPATHALTRAYAVNGAPRRYKLLRHPDIGTVPPERLLAASKKMQQQHFIRPYSNLSRLIDALDLPTQALPTVRTLKRYVDLVTGTDPRSGAFCSELVALYYAELGLPLFTGPKDAAAIAPSHLDTDACLLEEVPDAFFGREQLEGWLRNDVPLPILDRATFLPFAVKQQRELDAMAAFVDAAEQTLETVTKTSLASMNQMQCELEESVATSMLQYQAVGDVERVARADVLVMRARLLSHLLAAIQGQDQLRRAATVPYEDRDSWLRASAQLAQHYYMLHADLMHTHLRQTLLFATHLLRKTGRAEQKTRVRRKLARERKALLGAWRQRRAERAAAMRTLRGLLQTPTLDEAVIGHVERTLDLAMQAALTELAQLEQSFAVEGAARAWPAGHHRLDQRGSTDDQMEQAEQRCP